MTFDVYALGICAASVCTDATETELPALVTAVNLRHPTGITSRWQLSNDRRFRAGEPNPCPCDQAPGRRHFLLEC